MWLTRKLIQDLKEKQLLQRDVWSVTALYEPAESSFCRPAGSDPFIPASAFIRPLLPSAGENTAKVLMNPELHISTTK